MKKIRIRTSTEAFNSYDIVVGINIAKLANYIFKKYSDRKIFIITDNNVKNLYGNKLTDGLKSFGANVRLISFKAGEQSKTRQMKELLEDRLISSGANRSSLIIALGGGVVGDLAGFIAATFFRGIEYIQVPTTLIAQVDSSVGGKVGINHPSGKNLIGAFYPPKEVLIDTSVLKTLSFSDYLNGLAEVIKYSAVLDAELFEILENKSRLLKKLKLDVITEIVFRCCELKAKVISKDEREKSYRRILNFGHTIGHAIELLSNYKIRHGYAVARGMAVEADFSVRLGLLSKKDSDRLKTLLNKFGFETDLPKNYTMEDYLKAIQIDKKSNDFGVNFTLIKKIGSAKINVLLDENELKTLLMFYDLR